MTAVAPDGKLWWPSIKQSALHAFYLIPFSKEEWILPVYWTLAVEFQFYLAIGILFSIISRTAKVSPDLAVSLCAAFSLFSYAKHLIPQVQLLKFAPCFALGMVVAGWIIFRCKPATLIVCIVFVVSVAVASALDSKTLIGTVSASAVALFWVRPINRAHFLVKPFWWVGTISYSLYVTHQALASAGENLARLVLRFNDGWIFQVTANLIPLGTIVACFLAAWALYRFVERPTLEFSKKLRSH
jgi:peptidoglycan/LPS O-acetylase OafA/YrhL